MRERAVPYSVADSEYLARQRGNVKMFSSQRLLETAKQREECLAVLALAIVANCACDECGAPGTHYFLTEGDGPFWLCDQVAIGDDEHGDHAMPERYSGEEVEVGKRPFDDARAVLARARGAT